jgi:hypothetical protein
LTPITTFRRRRYKLWDQSILHASAWSPITTFRRRPYKLWDQSILSASAWSPITTFRRRPYKLWDQSILNASAWSPITTFRRRPYKFWDQSILHARAWSPIFIVLGFGWRCWPLMFSLFLVQNLWMFDTTLSTSINCLVPSFKVTLRSCTLVWYWTCYSVRTRNCCGWRHRGTWLRGKVKGKAIPYRPEQALSFPKDWGSQIPTQSPHEGDKFVSRMCRSPLLTRNIPGTHFC